MFSDPFSIAKSNLLLSRVLINSKLPFYPRKRIRVITYTFSIRLNLKTGKRYFNSECGFLILFSFGGWGGERGGNS